ncbi:MAG: GNAT family N-acetyltransferase [Deinococcales bacterium]
MQVTFEIRRALKRDLESWLGLCLAWTGAPAQKDPARLRELLEQALFDDDSTVYLAFLDAQLVGFAHITFQARPVRLGWRCTIEELHTLPAYIGRLEPAFLEAIVNECRERGDVIALYLLTQPDLEPRQFEFYGSLGFKERGREVLIWSGGL